MIMGSNRRLANVKTKREVGLDYVMQSIDLNTPFGKTKLKEIRPYYPGQEDELNAEFDKMEQMVQFVQENAKFVEQIQELFMEIKDVSYSIERANTQTLTVSIYTEVIRDCFGNAAAYSTVLTITSVVSLLLFFKLTGRKDISV